MKIVKLGELNENDPTFATRDGKLAGMVVYEYKRGWVLMIGGKHGVDGHHETLRECIESCVRYGYEFFVN